MMGVLDSQAIVVRDAGIRRDIESGARRELDPEPLPQDAERSSLVLDGGLRPPVDPGSGQDAVAVREPAVGELALRHRSANEG